MVLLKSTTTIFTGSVIFLEIIMPQRRPQFTLQQRNFLVMEFNKRKGTRSSLSLVISDFLAKFHHHQPLPTTTSHHYHLPSTTTARHHNPPPPTLLTAVKIMNKIKAHYCTLNVKALKVHFFVRHPVNGRYI